jgi:hypothetical protein
VARPKARRVRLPPRASVPLPGRTLLLHRTDSACLRWPGNSNPALDFVAAPALAPPEVHLSDADRAQLEADAQAAINAPLPDEVRSAPSPTYT